MGPPNSDPKVGTSNTGNGQKPMRFSTLSIYYAHYHVLNTIEKQTAKKIACPVVNLLLLSRILEGTQFSLLQVE